MSLILSKNRLLLKILEKEEERIAEKIEKRKRKRRELPKKNKELKRKKKYLKTLKKKKKLWNRLHVLNKEIAAIKENKKKRSKLSGTLMK